MDKLETKVTMTLQDYEELTNRAKIFDDMVHNTFDIEDDKLAINQSEFLTLLKSNGYLNKTYVRFVTVIR